MWLIISLTSFFVSTTGSLCGRLAATTPSTRLIFFPKT